jgi:uncharacterized protein YkwD
VADVKGVSNARAPVVTALAILGLAACGATAGPAAAHAPASRSASHRTAVHVTARSHRHSACTARSRATHARLATHRCPATAPRVNTPRHSAAKPPAPRHRAVRVTAPVTPPAAVPAPASAASQAASIASVLATQCQNVELTPEAGNLPMARSAVLCLINRVRAQHGEAPLQPNSALEAAAAEHDGELVADDYFAHIAPNGTTPVDRANATGYIPGPKVGYVIGENLAWGTLNLATPQSIVAAWVASPGHLANILEAQYRDTGIAVTPAVPASLGGGQQGATYAQEFGVIIG